MCNYSSSAFTRSASFALELDPSVEPTVQFLDADMVIGHWHNLQIVDQGGMILSEHVRALTTKTEGLAKHFPASIATLSILRAGAPISPKPVRAELATMMRDTRHIESQTAVVMEATGVFASVLRTTLRTMTVMSGNHRIKVVNTVDEALPFLLTLVRDGDGAAVTRAALEAVVHKVRALYGEELVRKQSHSG
jgi:hypothetical protein